MGNCSVSSRQHTDEVDVEYVFKVTTVDSDVRPYHNPNQRQCGTLKVTSSGLEYAHKTERIIWTWQHIRKYACNGEIFFFDVGSDHEEGEGRYGFSCKNIAELFLRVYNKLQKAVPNASIDGSLPDHSGREYNRILLPARTVAWTSSVTDTSTLNRTSESVESEDLASAVNFEIGTQTSCSSSTTSTENSSQSEISSVVSVKSAVQVSTDIGVNTDDAAVEIKCSDTASKDESPMTASSGSCSSANHIAVDCSSDLVQYRQIEFEHREDITLCPAMEKPSRSQIRQAQKKKKSHSSTASRHGRHTSLRSMSPLLEVSVYERSTASAPTSPSDVADTSFRGNSQDYFGHGYVNLEASDSSSSQDYFRHRYVNVENSYGSSSAPPLPPKGLKPSPPPQEASECCASVSVVACCSNEEGLAHKSEFEDESLEGLNISVENVDVFYPASYVEDAENGVPVQICTLCFDSSKAIMQCEDCATSVCGECAKQHLRMSMFASHTLSRLPEAKSTERRKSTGCLLSTKLKYAYLDFEADLQQESGGFDDIHHRVVFQEPSTRTKSCSDETFHKVNPVNRKKMNGGSLAVKYTSMDFELTKELHKLRVQREQERYLSTEERRAGFGSKYEAVKMKKFD